MTVIQITGPILWTLVSHDDGEEFMRAIKYAPVGSWNDVMEASNDLVLPETAKSYIVPTPGQFGIEEDDRDNVLIDDGSRIPIRWNWSRTYTMPIGEHTKFVSATLVTDTETYEIIKRTPSTITIRTTRQCEVAKIVQASNSEYPQIWTFVESDPNGRTFVVRKRKAGNFALNSMSPMRPALFLEGRPVCYTDYRF